MTTIHTAGELDFQITELPELPPFDSVAMADPRDFDVEYAINPHMLDANGQLQKVDRVRAREQWEALRETLVGCGMKVEVEPALDRHPDFVFCANPGLPIPAGVLGDRPRWVPSRMASDRRAGEVEYWSGVFEGRGWKVEPLQGAAERFEGTGDGLWHPKRRLLWGGVGTRTSLEAWEELAGRYELPIVILGLRDPDLYHLDTCLAPLDERSCLWRPAAFDEDGQALVRALFEDPIEVSEEDAKQHFACNAFAPQPKGLQAPHVVVIQEGATRTRAELKARGFQVLEVETNEFLKSGGSVFCMKLAFASHEAPS
jgi:N-dimethylarginine dimethylaminohydrolase